MGRHSKHRSKPTKEDQEPKEEAAELEVKGKTSTKSEKDNLIEKEKKDSKRKKKARDNKVDEDDVQKEISEDTSKHHKKKKRHDGKDEEFERLSSRHRSRGSKEVDRSYLIPGQTKVGEPIENINSKPDYPPTPEPEKPISVKLTEDTTVISSPNPVQIPVSVNVSRPLMRKFRFAARFNSIIGMLAAGAALLTVGGFGSVPYYVISAVTGVGAGVCTVITAVYAQLLLPELPIIVKSAKKFRRFSKISLISSAIHFCASILVYILVADSTKALEQFDVDYQAKARHLTIAMLAMGAFAFLFAVVLEVLISRYFPKFTRPTPKTPAIQYDGFNDESGSQTGGSGMISATALGESGQPTKITTDEGS